jgi:hypothetical protein
MELDALSSGSPLVRPGLSTLNEVYKRLTSKIVHMFMKHHLDTNLNAQREEFGMLLRTELKAKLKKEDESNETKE